MDDGTMTMTDDTLFDEPGANAKQATDNRRYALGALLATYRTRQGHSVERAAAHAGLGHMTWRRAEDGQPVRRKTHAALDAVIGVPVGTVQRALNDDDLMVDLMTHLGEDIPAGADAATVVARLARQASPRRDLDPRKLEASLRNLHAPLPEAGTDSQVAIHLAQRLSAHHQTPAITKAVQALLDALPDLVRRQIAADQHAPDEDDAG